MKLIAEGLRFPEGPVALHDGKLLVVEIEGQSIAYVDPAEGTIERIVRCRGGPNGLAFGPDGAAYVCNNGGSRWRVTDGLLRPGPPAENYAGGSVDRVDLATMQVRTLYASCEDHKLSAPNDIVFDGQGGFWFTDTGKNHKRSRDHGGVYYADPDGASIQQVLYPLSTPNGIGLSPDGRELYVAETITGKLWAWRITGRGCVASASRGPLGARLVYGFSGYQLLDSLAVDSAGNICVATLMTGAISVVTPAGQLLEQFRVPGDDPYVTNICFGGADLKTAYITSSGRGRLYAAEWQCPGLRLAFSNTAIALPS
jgi:gluconolactonase